MNSPISIIHPHAAGIDVGSRNFYVDAGEESIRVFATFTEDCNLIRDYLLSKGVTTVAMESTGVYWIILYDVLDQAGIEVYLVNGRDVKNLPGRKSDVKDCQWLRQLHSYGLLRKSFIPGGDIRKLRSYMRLRQDHIRAAATQVHLMQKALTQMNIRLTEQIDDITGASGLKIINAILDGQRDPAVLVELCHVSILRTKKELVLKSLEGHYSDEHLFALRQALGVWKYYNHLIWECDQEVEKLLKEMTRNEPDIDNKGLRKPVRYHAPAIKDLHKPLLKLTDGKDPIGIAGITDYSFLQIVSEIGTDMRAWPDEKHFTSWLKLASLKASSGKKSKKVVLKRQNKAGQIFRTLAQGILNSKHLALGAFGRRIRSRRCPAVAIKAVARKIACYYYRVMTKGAEFVELGIQAYEQQQRKQQERYLEKMALKFNMLLVPVQDSSVCP
jgi:transposase